MRRLVAVLALGAACALGACGDDDDNGSAAGEDLVRTAATAWATEFDSDACASLVTADFVQRVWTSEAKCRTASASNPNRMSGVQVGEISVDGDRATARLSGTLEGSEVEGGLVLERQANGWRVDDFGPDLIRSILVSLLPDKYVEAAADDDVDIADDVRASGVGPCIERDLRKLRDGATVQIGYAAFADRDDSPEEQKVIGLLVTCLAETPRGQSALRAAFDAGIREKAPTKEAADCVLRELEESLSDKVVADLTVAQLTDRAGQDATADLGQKVGQARSTCGV